MSIGPYGSPSPGSTSLSTPVWSDTLTPTDQQSSDPGSPPADFINFTVAKLKQMIGARAYLVDDATLQNIAQKLWQNVGMQQTWEAYNQIAPQTVATQLQALILNTSGDTSVDPSILSDYITAKETAGESLSNAELAALSLNSQAINAVVPKPFDTSTVSGYRFGDPMPAGGWSSKAPGQSFGWDHHLGTDYGTPAGSRIVTPFAGTVHVQTGVPGYGNYVYVDLDNGWRIGFGHVASGAAPDGTRVNPGDLIAISGANVGSSQGAVTIVTLQNAQHQYVDPALVLNPIFTGTTFGALQFTDASGASFNGGGVAGIGSTTINTALDRQYPGIKQDWIRYFGSPPSPEDILNVTVHGTSPDQWSDYIRSLPGHIPGLTVGQAFDTRQMVDAVSQKLLGHPGTDGIVKELYDAGDTSQQAIQSWYDFHSPNQIDKETYQKIYGAQQPIMASVYNEPAGADPRTIQNIYNAGQGDILPIQ